MSSKTQLKVVNGGKFTQELAPVSELTVMESLSSRAAPTITRLHDIVAARQALQVACGTCGHVAIMRPTDIAAPGDLPLAEVRRMVACGPCGSRWIDVREVSLGEWTRSARRS